MIGTIVSVDERGAIKAKYVNLITGEVMPFTLSELKEWSDAIDEKLKKIVAKVYSDAFNNSQTTP